MERLRASLTAGLLPKIEKELGRETTLRLLWPQVVGSQLALHTELKGSRGTVLLIGVRDRSWIRTLGPLQSTMLDAINRWVGGQYKSIEMQEQSGMPAPPQIASVSAAKRRAPVDAGVLSAAGAIADSALRAAFCESAAKYFAAQSAPAPASTEEGEES